MADGAEPENCQAYSQDDGGDDDERQPQGSGPEHGIHAEERWCPGQVQGQLDDVGEQCAPRRPGDRRRQTSQAATAMAVYRTVQTVPKTQSGGVQGALLAARTSRGRSR